MSRKVGALWRNQVAKDKSKAYLAGVVDMGILGQVRVVIFKNELKEKDSQPDYHILLAENQNGQTAQPEENPFP